MIEFRNRAAACASLIVAMTCLTARPAMQQPSRIPIADALLPGLTGELVWKGQRRELKEGQQAVTVRHH